ncbi:hypothetical protein RZS08_61350, partial [Arthrospira platensis SPKY1]|nr:hypothetical protein [Arthrospira platensis SPKY1]
PNPVGRHRAIAVIGDGGGVGPRGRVPKALEETAMGGVILGQNSLHVVAGHLKPQRGGSAGQDANLGHRAQPLDSEQTITLNASLPQSGFQGLAGFIIPHNAH